MLVSNVDVISAAVRAVLMRTIGRRGLENH